MINSITNCTVDEFLSYFLYLQVANMSVLIPTENIEQISGCVAEKLNAAVAELRRLFLVDNMIDTLKFGLSLWCLTYIGSWFNAMTLVILAWIAAFSLPKVYIMNQVLAYIDCRRICIVVHG